MRTILRQYRQLRDSYEEELHFARQLLECSVEGMMVLDAEGRWDADRFRAKLAQVNAVPVDGEPEPEVVIGTIALLVQ